MRIKRVSHPIENFEDHNYLTHFENIDPISYEEMEKIAMLTLEEARSNTDYLRINSHGDYFIDSDAFSQGDFVEIMRSVDIDLVHDLANGRDKIDHVDIDDIRDQSNDIGYSEAFTSFLEDLFEITNDTHQSDYAVIESKLVQLIGSIERGGYSEFEKPALEVIVNLSIATIKSAYQANLLEIVNGRSCNTNWRRVANTAIVTGIVSGFKLGWDGMVAGAIATTAAGNPVVGGVIGGLAGFATGFIGGAIAGGIAQYAADKITCSGKTTKKGSQPKLSNYSICLDKFCKKRRPLINKYGVLYLI